MQKRVWYGNQFVQNSVTRACKRQEKIWGTWYRISHMPMVSFTSRCDEDTGVELFGKDPIGSLSRFIVPGVSCTQARANIINPQPTGDVI